MMDEYTQLLMKRGIIVDDKEIDLIGAIGEIANLLAEIQVKQDQTNEFLKALSEFLGITFIKNKEETGFHLAITEYDPEKGGILGKLIQDVTELKERSK